MSEKRRRKMMNNSQTMGSGKIDGARIYGMAGRETVRERKKKEGGGRKRAGKNIEGMSNEENGE